MAHTGLPISIRDYAVHAWDLRMTSFTANCYEAVLAIAFISRMGLFGYKLSILLLPPFVSERIGEHGIASPLALDG